MIQLEGFSESRTHYFSLFLTMIHSLGSWAIGVAYSVLVLEHVLCFLAFSAALSGRQWVFPLKQSRGAVRGPLLGRLYVSLKGMTHISTCE